MDVSGPNSDDFRAKVFRDRAHIGDWRVEKLDDDGSPSRSRSSAAGMHESAPSVTPIANTVIDLLRKIAFLACAKDRREDVSAAFDKKILAPAIEAFRAGQARRDEIREASGCAALRREEAETVDRLIDVENRIAKTPAVSLAGLVAQIEYFRDSIDPLVGWDVIIQGLRTVVQPRCIGFGEPEANG